MAAVHGGDRLKAVTEQFDEGQVETFLKVAFVVILFIMAFALGFHCLLGEQVVFIISIV